MGGGAWTTASVRNYVSNNALFTSLGATTLDSLTSFSASQVYTAKRIDPLLDPKNVIRECCDSEEHPNTFPVIIGLDVTGSMGKATVACAAKLNDIMENLYGKVSDIEFMMMGIGDLAYDDAPIQVTQFESDIRILDQTTKIYFESGGGGNSYESYTAAWYFGLYHTKLDCWKRGKRGLIITMGDEPLNPYLPGVNLAEATGDSVQDIDTVELYDEVIKKFDVYHIAITDQESSFARYEERIKNSWGKILGQHLLFGKSDDLPEIIGNIVDDHLGNSTFVVNSAGDGIKW